MGVGVDVWVGDVEGGKGRKGRKRRGMGGRDEI